MRVRHCDVLDDTVIENFSLSVIRHCNAFVFFFFNDTATTEIYTLSLHDPLPISLSVCSISRGLPIECLHGSRRNRDRKSTRLNSSHGYISYAVFCLKKKKK